MNNELRVPNPVTVNGTEIYYRNTAFPSTGITLLSISYYDTYPPGSPSIPGTVLGQPVLSQQTDSSNDASTNSFATAFYVRNIEDNAWTKTYTYYDSMGRGVSTYSVNHLGGRTWTESKLDFAGVVQQTVTRHKRLDTDTDRVITENFTYDHQNRLLTHTHQVDNNPVEYLAQNTYNELSQLKSKKVGGTSPSTSLQQVDYLYNIRGWMTRINDPKNLGGKLFGYEIKYNNPENPDIAPGRFNGNIAEVDWNTGSDNLLKRYNYQYDKLNRLTNAFYKEPTTGNSNYFDEYLTYDPNGNIKTLKRTAVPVSGTSETLIDNLEYKYTGNRLNQVIEHEPNPTGYEGGNNMIDYDLNGNMTTMRDKGIFGITYNHLNLPDVFGITQANPFSNTFTNFSLEYLYRADGTKVRKTYNSGGGRGNPTIVKNMTDYLDGFQYKYSEVTQCLWCRTSVAYEQEAFKDPIIPGTLTPSWILDFVGTAEGFYSFAENRYIYQYLDHLGNARVSYGKDGGGNLQITDFNNYYAFGMNHIGGLKSKLGGYQSYKYNGKEIQESGMYDYGARFYMPDIGRWGVVDPRSQYTHESYSYVWNNPIRFADPTGMTGEQISDWVKNGNTYRWDPNVTGPENTPKGWEYVGPTGSYKIPGATVQLLAGGKTFTDIDEVVETRKSPAAAGIILTQNAEFGMFALLAVVSWYVIDDLIGTLPIQHGIEIDPNLYRHTDNTESDADEDKDVNGADVPQQHGGGKNGQHKNQKAKQSAQQEYERALADYNNLKSKTNKTPQDKKDLKKAENQKNHWKKKADETGENHSQKAKGSN